MASGPPITTPVVPTKNITTIFQPSRAIALRSRLRVSSTKLVGNR